MYGDHRWGGSCASEVTPQQPTGAGAFRPAPTAKAQEKFLPSNTCPRGFIAGSVLLPAAVLLSCWRTSLLP